MVNLCLLSWNDKLPDYKVIEWNESNFPFEIEFDRCPFLKECYDRRLWAFVSDYVRVYVLAQFGGVYLDTDMLIVKTLNPLLGDRVFLGFETDKRINLAIAGSSPDHPLWNSLLQFYRDEVWFSHLYTVPEITTAELARNYDLRLNGKPQTLHDSIRVYPREYFYPYYYNEEFTLDCVKADTYSIHWWSTSWKSRKAKLFLRTKHLRGWRKIFKQLALVMRF